MNTHDPGTDQKTGKRSTATRRGQGILQPRTVLVAGRAAETVNAIVSDLSRTNQFVVSSQIINNGHADPLHGLDTYPDALVFVLSSAWEDELTSLAERPAAARPPSLIISLEENPQTMRLAMRAGAREFLKWPEQNEELKSTLDLIAEECAEGGEVRLARITSVINAKGGSGATFIASALAHILADQDELRTALLDLDMQFSGLGSYFDLQLKHDLTEVLEAVPEMDQTALSGYMSRHESGLHLLGSSGATIGLSEEVDAERFLVLLDLLSISYERLVIDVPRHLDHMTIQALESSDKIVVVLQQNLMSLKDAIRLLAVLRNDLAVAKNRLIVIVNRYDKNGDITLEDIKSALCIDTILTVANDFSMVAESLNRGVPILELAKNSKITRSLVAANAAIDGRAPDSGSGLVEKAMTGIRRMMETKQSP